MTLLRQAANYDLHTLVSLLDLSIVLLGKDGGYGIVHRVFPTREGCAAFHQ
jgi:translation initiation factor RLI1